jgi:hypothetical protein
VSINENDISLSKIQDIALCGNAQILGKNISTRSKKKPGLRILVESWPDFDYSDSI